MDVIADNNTVFMLFFAIAWGIVANVQGRWKAFHWPLVHRVNQACHRALLSFVLLNLVPFIFFAYVLYVLKFNCQTSLKLFPLEAILELVIQAMLPALGNFGFYRVWIGVIEFKPKWFYETDPWRLPEDFRHVEPTVRFGLPQAQSEWKSRSSKRKRGGRGLQG